MVYYRLHLSEMGRNAAWEIGYYHLDPEEEPKHITLTIRAKMFAPKKAKPPNGQQDTPACKPAMKW